jgi:predicted glycogen debranching enzyme
VNTDLGVASAREWLVTNGIGGYASGTIDGSATRRYHGWLVAALDPPAARTLLVAKLDERVEYGGTTWALTTNRWASGAIDPPGYENIEKFFLDGLTPVWYFSLGDALVERRLVMQTGANTTFVRYRVLRASSKLHFTVKAIVDYRDFHNVTHAAGDGLMADLFGGTVRVRASPGGEPVAWLKADAAEIQVENIWYRDYDLPAERERGLEDREDHLHAATFTTELMEGGRWTVTLAAGNAWHDAQFDAFVAAERDEAALLRAWRVRNESAAREAPLAIRRLVLAASQFLVERALPGLPQGRSVIAGYHWFGDWGRDAMIALPGLTLVTGRPEIALAILRTFGRLLERGLLPNDFPNRGTPGYNTVDASLWYVEAVRAYVEATGDDAALAELWPSLLSIVDWYERGTDFGIGADPEDGLLRAGASGVQLTWMDAKVGDTVITPRTGKPVEINALWYNALRTLAEFAPRAAGDVSRFEKMAERVRAGFARFESAQTGGLFDVIDGPEGDDATIRPNQIFAVSLHHSPIDPPLQRAVVDLCARDLLTPMGLRSLSPRDPRYVGRYLGSPAQRDAAYHQGTVWTWLIGPFALAHARANDDRAGALATLQPLLDRVSEPGNATLGEIADGDAPFEPRGCISQAWSVAEVLRAWHALQG